MALLRSSRYEFSRPSVQRAVGYFPHSTLTPGLMAAVTGAEVPITMAGLDRKDVGAAML